MRVHVRVHVYVFVQSAHHSSQSFEQIPDAMETDARLKRTSSFLQRNLLMEAVGLDQPDASSSIMGIPAVNHKGERLWVYVGIIDILVQFKTRKKLEHAIKAAMYDGDQASAAGRSLIVCPPLCVCVCLFLSVCVVLCSVGQCPRV